MENEKPPLPEGWEWRRLGDVVTLRKESILPSDEQDRDFNYIGLENIESNTGSLIDFKPTKGKEIKSTKSIFRATDVLYGKLRPYLNKVHLPEFDGICSTDILPLITDDAVDRVYLAYYLRSKGVVDYASKHMTGTKMPRIRLKDFNSIKIPLPPLPVQKQIVEKLDTLMAGIESAKKLHEQSAGLTRTLMQAAIEHEFKRAEEEGWEWRRLGDVAEINPHYKLVKEQTYPYVEMAAVNIEKGKIDYYKQRKYKGSGNSKFKNGDILFGRITPCTENGKVALVDNLETDFGFGSTELIVINPKSIIPKFLYYYFIRPNVRNYCVSKMTGSTGRQRVPNDVFKQELEIPLPLLPVQKQIVEKLDAFREMVESLKQQQKERSEWLEKLPKALLEKAFRGEL